MKEYQPMNDEDLYLQATKEVEGDSKNPALWAKAMALSEGDEGKAKYQYIKLRVGQLEEERKNAKPAFTKKSVDEFELKYMPIAEFSRIKSIPENKVIEMIGDGFYIGQIKNDAWYVSRDEVKKEDRVFNASKTVGNIQKSTKSQYVPVEEFAEYKGITSEKAIQMIRDGFYQGQIIEDHWYVAFSEIDNKESDKHFTFDNLGIWRKIYLILNWLVLIVVSVIFLISVISLGSRGTIETFFLLFWGWPLTIWLHMAIIGRKVIQLRWLAGLNLIPLLNPVGAIVIWLISSTSKDEIEKSILK